MDFKGESANMVDTETLQRREVIGMRGLITEWE